MISKFILFSMLGFTFGIYTASIGIFVRDAKFWILLGMLLAAFTIGLLPKS